MIKVIAIATKMFRVAGMLEYGIEDKSLTAQDISSLIQYAININIFESMGSRVLKHEAKIAATKPPPHRIVKIGVQMIFDSGATSGS